MTIKIVLGHLKGLGLPSIQTAKPQASRREKWRKHALEAVA